MYFLNDTGATADMMGGGEVMGSFASFAILIVLFIVIKEIIIFYYLQNLRFIFFLRNDIAYYIIQRRSDDFRRDS